MIRGIDPQHAARLRNQYGSAYVEAVIETIQRFHDYHPAVEAVFGISSARAAALAVVAFPDVPHRQIFPGEDRDRTILVFVRGQCVILQPVIEKKQCVRWTTMGTTFVS